MLNCISRGPRTTFMCKTHQCRCPFITCLLGSLAQWWRHTGVGLTPCHQQWLLDAWQEGEQDGDLPRSPSHLTTEGWFDAKAKSIWPDPLLGTSRPLVLLSDSSLSLQNPYPHCRWHLLQVFGCSSWSSSPESCACLTASTLNLFVLPLHCWLFHSPLVLFE